MNKTKKNNRLKSSKQRIRRNYTYKQKYMKDLIHNYPSCKFDEAGFDKSQYGEHKITYGEMEYEGIKKLYKIVSSYKKINYFMDIGSGRGKLCFFMSSFHNILKVLGIELVKERYEDALLLRDKLNDKIVKKIDFINGNVLDINLYEKLRFDAPNERLDASIFVWMSNLCFEHETTLRILNKLQDELPYGTIICLSKEPPSLPSKIKKIKNTKIEMSWCKDSSVTIYEIKSE